MTGTSTTSATETVTTVGANVADRFVASARQVVKLVAWVHLYLIAMLGGWILMVMLSTGWQPVVLTTGSMAPTLRPGDVLMLDTEPGGAVGQRSVITFSPDPSRLELITHRVFEVMDDGRYVTKGDANPGPDTDRVSPDQVRGVGRLVVPLIGLPVVWAGGGELVPLAAFGVMTIAALAIAGRAITLTRRSNGAGRPTTRLADRGVRLVRLLAGLMMISQFFVDVGRFESQSYGISRNQLVAVVLLGLGIVNALSVVGSRTDDPARSRKVARFELAGDTMIVILLTTASAGSGVGWVLMALPIVEAAVRFRLVGALTHWMAMVAVTFVSRLWVMDRTGASLNEVMANLEELLDQFGVLLLVAIPGAYLAEQLMADVATQRAATTSAVERGHRLEHVAEISHEVNRIGTQLFDTLTSATLKLGFDAADVCVKRPGGEWLKVAASEAAPLGELPPPGHPGSGLREIDLIHPEVMVDRSDPEVGEHAAVAEVGLGSLTRIVLSGGGGSYIGLRAGSRRSHVEAGSIEALRLLCGQATVALQNQQLVTELKEVHDELEHQAMHDVLTALPNRARFLQELTRSLVEASDPTRRHMVLFLDLNGFKAVNDTHGHEAGDELLRMVSSRLTEAIGSSGLVARLGGDEFTVLLKPLATGEEAMASASKIHAALSTPFDLGTSRALVGTSIGISWAEPGVDETEMLRRADAAMYAAKSRGGSVRTALYDPSMDEGDRRRGRLSAEFRGAFERNELRLAYQPIVSTTDGVIVGVEALLRWTHRELGEVSTATILELANLSGLREELTAWIVTTALGGLRELDRVDDPAFFVAVNLSPTELESSSLIDMISDALLVAGIAPHRLVIELSERLIAEQLDQRGNIQALASIGVTLSLDDFGEGRTSLSHLRGVPLSHLKLDRTMVQQAGTADIDRTILKSITALAHELSLLVVAEGIETSQHLDLATVAGVDLLQGFGIYRPMPIHQLQSVMSQDDRDPVTDGGAI